MYESKKQNGITLIALVITIIILLILAGVTINVLIGDNGLFKTAKTAGEDYIKSQLKEELEMEIANIQSKKIAEGKELKREDLLELKEIGAEIISVEIPAQGNYKNYKFTVDENYIVTIGKKGNIIKPKIELTKDTEEIVEEVTIKVKVTTEEGTIVSITKPDGTEATETEFDYKVKENKIYTFEAKGSNGGRAVESIEITNVKETAEAPVIKSNYGYPILTSTGVINNGMTTITYDKKEGLENYYSIDNGQTWNEYTEPFNVSSATTIKAKSVKNGNILSEASAKVTKPADGLGATAFDGKTSTSVKWDGDMNGMGYFMMKVDSSAIGKKLYIHADNTWSDYLYALLRVIWVYKDGKTEEVYNKTADGTLEPKIVIPNNVANVKIGIQPKRVINEVSIVD